MDMRAPLLVVVSHFGDNISYFAFFIFIVFAF